MIPKGWRKANTVKAYLWYLRGFHVKFTNKGPMSVIGIVQSASDEEKYSFAFSSEILNKQTLHVYLSFTRHQHDCAPESH